MVFANGAQSDYAYDARLRPAQGTASMGMSVVMDRSAAWNDTNQLSMRADDRPGGTSFSFGVDSLGRRVQSTETPAMGSPTVIDYTLTDHGDRSAVSGGAQAGAYVLDPTAPVPADAQVHQYTATPFDTRAYDENGNLAARDPAGPTAADSFERDYRDRPVRYTDGDSGLETTYVYDPFERRVMVVQDSAGPMPVETLVALYGRRAVEETDGAGATLATYVWSGVDSLIYTATAAHLACLRRGGVDHAVHQDPLGNVSALTDAGGDLAEWYEYGDFGQPRIFDANGAALSESAVGNPYLLGGARYDAESGLYSLGEHGPWWGASYYEPAVGRTLSRSARLYGEAGFEQMPDTLAARGAVAVEPTDRDDHQLTGAGADPSRRAGAGAGVIEITGYLRARGRAAAAGLAAWDGESAGIGGATPGTALPSGLIDLTLFAGLSRGGGGSPYRSGARASVIEITGYLRGRAGGAGAGLAVWDGDHVGISGATPGTALPNGLIDLTIWASLSRGGRRDAPSMAAFGGTSGATPLWSAPASLTPLLDRLLTGG
jgi:hypothetical protein